MRRRLGLLAAVLVVVAGCGGESPPAAHKRAAPTPTAAPASSGDGLCGQTGIRARAVQFRTSDGVKLSGAVLGSGPVGAVLIHEWPRDYCGWLPYAGYLSHHGVRALAFDLRCFGRSDCPDGGRGHATVDVAAARLHPAAVVDLSGERTTRGLTPGIDADAGAAAHGVTAPALFAVARGDRYVAPGDMRTVARRARSATKRVIVLPATAGHGWDLLFGSTTDWSRLAATVAAFIRRHAGPRR